jgi:hypothetical protein
MKLENILKYFIFDMEFSKLNELFERHMLKAALVLQYVMLKCEIYFVTEKFLNKLLKIVEILFFLILGSS